MDRRILFPLISMFLALLCSDIISAQNWIFKGVAVSDEGIYAMTENNTLVKLTESLEPLWMIEIQKNVHIKRLIPADNGVLLLGDVLAKLDGDGTLLWAKNVSARDARALPDGCVVFTDGKVVGVIDKNGKPLWTIKFATRATEVPPSVRINALAPLDGYILVAGTSILPDDPKSHLFIGVLSRDGTLIWAKVLNTGYYDYPDVAISLGNNGLIAGVYGGGSDAPWIADYFALRVSLEGKIEWFNSYTWPREEDWDKFWSMKVLGAACNDGICALGTKTGTFVINAEGKLLTGLNFSGKVLRVENNSILLLSNGTLLTVPLKGAECRAYSSSVQFKEITPDVKVVTAELKGGEVYLQVMKIKEATRPDHGIQNTGDKGQARGAYLGVILAVVLIVGTALVAKLRK